MKTFLKQYKLLIAAVIIAMCLSSCYVYPGSYGYGGGYGYYNRRPHYRHYYGY